jgi:2-dehydropantoate 2-reductase
MSTSSDAAHQARILVVGAGAVGGLFGARLADAGRDVTFLLRPHRAEQIRKDGLHIVDGGEHHVVHPQVTTADEIDSPADVILLGLRATALAAALDDVSPAVGENTAIVPVLNGLAHLDVLDARFGRERVLGGVALTVTSLDEDGNVVALAPTAQLTVGERTDSYAGRAKAVQAALGGAGFDVRVSDDIVGEMWAKWSFIATVGALTCLMRAPVGEIVAAPCGTDLGVGLLAETTAIAAAAGHPVAEDAVANTRSAVTQPGSALTSSMYRDVVAGRRTEVEHVLADLAGRGRALGVGTPLLDLATLHLRVRERMLDR